MESKQKVGRLACVSRNVNIAKDVNFPGERKQK